MGFFTRLFAKKVRLRDPYGILQEFNPDAARMVDAKPDIESELARITRTIPDDYENRIPKGKYLEPYFFHPNQAVQARAASACVSVDVGKLGDYLINVLATATATATLQAAATAVWKRHQTGTGGIGYVVDSMRSYLHSLGSAKVRQIVDILLQHAPNAEARTTLSDQASSALGV